MNLRADLDGLNHRSRPLILSPHVQSLTSSARRSPQDPCRNEQISQQPHRCRHQLGTNPLNVSSRARNPALFTRRAPKHTGMQASKCTRHPTGSALTEVSTDPMNRWSMSTAATETSGPERRSHGPRSDTDAAAREPPASPPRAPSPRGSSRLAPRRLASYRLDAPAFPSSCPVGWPVFNDVVLPPPSPQSDCSTSPALV